MTSILTGTERFFSAVLQTSASVVRKLDQFGFGPTVRHLLERLLGNVGSANRWQTAERSELVGRQNGFDRIFHVSVVVPTKDGGEELDRLLDSLSSQRGCRIEVVLVDSSLDHKVITRIVGTKQPTTIPIKASDFSHSDSRNLGVRHTVSPLVFLTVQDAVLPDENWMHDLCALLTLRGLDALSVSERWGDDCDFFGKFAVQSYNNNLFLSESGLAVYSDLGKRRPDQIFAASISNVGCLYRREVLTDISFEGTFGEDLQMGISLLRSGRRIGRTNALPLVHSHTRAPTYWMNRMFISRKLMDSLNLGEPLRITRERQLCAAIAGMLEAIDVSLSGESELIDSHGFGPARSRGLEHLATLAPELSKWIRVFRWEHARANSWRHEFLGIRNDLQAFAAEQCLGPVPPMALVQAFAARLGWIMGACPAKQNWSTEEVSGRMATLGTGV